MELCIKINNYIKLSFWAVSLDSFKILLENNGNKCRIFENLPILPFGCYCSTLLFYPNGKLVIFHLIITNSLSRISTYKICYIDFIGAFHLILALLIPNQILYSSCFSIQTINISLVCSLTFFLKNQIFLVWQAESKESCQELIGNSSLLFSDFASLPLKILTAKRTDLPLTDKIFWAKFSSNSVAYFIY